MALPALVADGRHVLTDVVTSAGVIVGVALASVTGRIWTGPSLRFWAHGHFRFRLRTISMNISNGESEVHDEGPRVHI